MRLKLALCLALLVLIGAASEECVCCQKGSYSKTWMAKSFCSDSMNSDFKYDGGCKVLGTADCYTPEGTYMDYTYKCDLPAVSRQSLNGRTLTVLCKKDLTLVILGVEVLSSGSTAVEKDGFDKCFTNYGNGGWSSSCDVSDAKTDNVESDVSNHLFTKYGLAATCTYDCKWGPDAVTCTTNGYKPDCDATCVKQGDCFGGEAMTEKFCPDRGICCKEATSPPSGGSAGAPLGKRIWLKARSNGKYVCADKGKSDTAPLYASRDKADSWETFAVEDAGSGWVRLKAEATGKYVQADKDKSFVLEADGGAGDWEKFAWEVVGDGIALKAFISGKYVAADQSSDVQMIADRVSAAGWETFAWGDIAPASGTGGDGTGSPQVAGGAADCPGDYCIKAEVLSTLSSTSIADAFATLGCPAPNLDARKAIYKATYNKDDYTGTADQNVALLNDLRANKVVIKKENVGPDIGTGCIKAASVVAKAQSPPAGPSPQDVAALTSSGDCKNAFTLTSAVYYDDGTKDAVAAKAKAMAAALCPAGCVGKTDAYSDKDASGKTFFMGAVTCYDPRKYQEAQPVARDPGKEHGTPSTSTTQSETAGCVASCKSLCTGDKGDYLGSLVLNVQRAKTALSAENTLPCICECRTCSCCYTAAGALTWVNDAASCSGSLVDASVCGAANAQKDASSPTACRPPYTVTPDCVECCKAPDGTKWKPLKCADYKNAQVTAEPDKTKCTTADKCTIVTEPYLRTGVVCCRVADIASMATAAPSASSKMYRWVDLDNKGVCHQAQRERDDLCPLAEGAEGCCIYMGASKEGLLSAKTSAADCVKLANQANAAEGKRALYPNAYCTMDLGGTCTGSAASPDFPVLVRASASPTLAAACRQESASCPAVDVPAADAGKYKLFRIKANKGFTITWTTTAPSSPALSLELLNAKKELLAPLPIGTFSTTPTTKYESVVSGYDLLKAYMDATKGKAVGCLGCKVAKANAGPDPTDATLKLIELCISQDVALKQYACDSAMCAESLKERLGDKLKPPVTNAGSLWTFKVAAGEDVLSKCASDLSCLKEDVLHDTIYLDDFKDATKQKALASKKGDIVCGASTITASDNLNQHITQVKAFWVGARAFYVALADDLRTVEDALKKQCTSCNKALADFVGMEGVPAADAALTSPTGVKIALSRYETSRESTFTFGTTYTAGDAALKDGPCKDAFKSMTVAKGTGTDVAISIVTNADGKVEFYLTTLSPKNYYPGGLQCGFERKEDNWDFSAPVRSKCKKDDLFCKCHDKLGLTQELGEDFIATDDFGPQLCDSGATTICLDAKAKICPATAISRTVEMAKAKACPVCIELPCIYGAAVHDGNKDGATSCDQGTVNEADRPCTRDEHKYVCGVTAAPPQDLGFGSPTGHCDASKAGSMTCSCGKDCTKTETDVLGGVLEIKRETNYVVMPPKLEECHKRVLDLKDLCTVEGSQYLLDPTNKKTKGGPCKVRERVTKVIEQLDTLIKAINDDEATDDMDGTDAVSSFNRIVNDYKGSLEGDKLASGKIGEFNAKLAAAFNLGAYDTFKTDLKNIVLMMDHVRKDVEGPNQFAADLSKYETISALETSWAAVAACDKVRSDYDELKFESATCSASRRYTIAQLKEAFGKTVDELLKTKCVSTATYDSKKPRGRCDMPKEKTEKLSDHNFDKWGPLHIAAAAFIDALDSADSVKEADLLLDIKNCLGYRTNGQVVAATAATTTPTTTTTTPGTTPTTTGSGYAVGEACDNKNYRCASGNCQNGICCENGRICCDNDGVCKTLKGDKAVCDKSAGRSYCVDSANSNSPFPCVKRYDDGEECDSNSECKSQNCDADAKVCCKRSMDCCTKAAHCGTGYVCDKDKYYCVEDPNAVKPMSRKVGEACASSIDCETSNCRNKVCCMSGEDCCTASGQCREDLGETCDAATKHFCVEKAPAPKPEADPCVQLCLSKCSSLGATGGHCHAELGYCVCDIGGFDAQPTSIKCTARAVSAEAKARLTSCCESLFGVEPSGDEPELLPDPFAGAAGAECSRAAAFNDGKVHYDSCTSALSDLNLCCHFGGEERPLTRACYSQGSAATCKSMCSAQLGKPNSACEKACKGASIDCEKACLEASLPDDTATLLKCMRGEIPGMRSCKASDGVYMDIIDCFGAYSTPAERVACAKAMKGMAPSITVDAVGLYKGDTNQPTFYAGEQAAVRATLKNDGALFFGGSVTFKVRASKPCDPKAGCTSPEVVDTLVLAPAASREVSLLAGGSAKVESQAVALGAEWIGLDVVAEVSVSDGAEDVALVRSKSVAVLKMGRIAPYDAYFEVGGVEHATTAYPLQKVTGTVSLTSEYFPLKASVYLVGANNKEIAGTRSDEQFQARLSEAVLVRTKAFEVPKEYAFFGNILHIGFDAYDRDGKLIASAVLSTPTSCSPSVCPEEYLNVRMEYPEAYLKVESPELKVVSAHFVDAAGGQVPATSLYQKRDMRAEVVVKNAAGIPFDGTVSVAVLDGTGSEAVKADEDRSSKALGAGESATIATGAFSAKEGRTYKLMVVASKGGVDWFKRELSKISYPFAVLEVADIATVQGEGPRDYSVTYSLGSCVLRVKCTRCLPTCEILIDQPTCAFRTEGVCSSPGGTCSCSKA